MSRISGRPREIVNGTLPDWTGFTATEDTITAKASFVAFGSKFIDYPIFVKVRATDAESNTFVKSDVQAVPEPFPINLAQKIYESLSILQHEGAIELVQRESNSGADMGKVLNILGIIGPWEAMRATITRIDEDLFTGKTNISFGPAKHLSLGELMELLRLLRGRVRPRVTRTNAQVNADAQVNLGQQSTPLSGGSGGVGKQTKLMISADGETGVSIDSADAAGVLLKIIEIDDVCIDGEPYKLKLIGHLEKKPPTS